MSQRVNFLLSLIGLLGVAFFSVEFARKLKDLNGNASRRRLEAPHTDKIPGSLLVKALINISKDIYAVTDDLIASSNIHNVISWQDGWDFKFWLDSVDSTEAMIVKSTGWDGGYKTVIVFRGSEEVDDWLTNLETVQRHFPNAPYNVKVHQGFLESLVDNQQIRIITEAMETKVLPSANVISLLEEKALEVMGGTNELHLTGHSLG